MKIKEMTKRVREAGLDHGLTGKALAISHWSDNDAKGDLPFDVFLESIGVLDAGKLHPGFTNELWAAYVGGLMAARV